MFGETIMRVIYKPETLKIRQELKTRADKARLELATLKEMLYADGVDKKDIHKLIKEKREEYIDINNTIVKIKNTAVSLASANERAEAKLNRKILHVLRKKISNKAYKHLVAEAKENLALEEM